MHDKKDFGYMSNRGTPLCGFYYTVMQICGGGILFLSEGLEITGIYVELFEQTLVWCNPAAYDLFEGA